MKHTTPEPTRANQQSDIKYRCPICGRDVQQKVPTNITIAKSTLAKINEIDPTVKVISQDVYNSVFSLKLDEFTLRPINGEGFQININLCRRCIARIGYRHKYQIKNKERSYATKQI